MDAMDAWNDRIKDFPEALQPVFTTPKANADIPLYNGNLRLHVGASVANAHITVSVSWFPTPRVRFRIEKCDPIKIDLFESDIKLELVDKWPNELVDGQILQQTIPWHSSTYTASGQIPLWEFNRDTAVQKITFHLPNLRGFRGETIREGRGVRVGRQTLAAAGWQIIIDENNETRDLSKELKETGGFGITHTGCLVRQDGSPFSIADAEEHLDRLHGLLSFCNGRWTGPFLWIGYDNDSKPVSHHWGVPNITPYQTVAGWFSDLQLGVLSKLYPGFIDRWTNDTWRQAIHTAIYWYVLGNSPGGSVENGVVASQIAFEALSWTLFVEDSKVLSKNTFNRKLEALDKLRLLLNHCGIGLEIPNELPGLKAAALAAQPKWSDGATAIVAIRNSYVHPSRNKQDNLAKLGTDVEREAYQLSLNYLELVLLRLFNYDGHYSDRLVSIGFKGAEEKPVPWCDP